MSGDSRPAGIMARLYSVFHRASSSPGERGEYSAGVWQDLVRKKALAACGRARGSLLEIGCGEGLFLAQAKALNPSLALHGIDNSAARVEACRRRLGQESAIEAGDALRLPYPDGRFDVVVCVNVLFNLASFREVEMAVKEMARVCRPGGTAVIDIRNAANPLLALKYALAPWYDPSVKRLPLRTYRYGRVRRLLEREGMTVTAARPVGFCWRLLAPVIVIEAKK